MVDGFSHATIFWGSFLTIYDLINEMYHFKAWNKKSKALN